MSLLHTSRSGCILRVMFRIPVQVAPLAERPQVAGIVVVYVVVKVGDGQDDTNTSTILRSCPAREKVKLCLEFQKRTVALSQADRVIEHAAELTPVICLVENLPSN